MTNGEYKVDTEELRRIAAGLESEGAALRQGPVDPNRGADAGVSTGETAQAVAHLADSTRDLAKLLEGMAKRLTDTAKSYEDVDAQAAAKLEQSGRWTPRTEQ